MNDDRGTVRRMPAEECFARLREQQRGVGRIAISQGRPVILPVNYLLDGVDLVFRTAAGTKLEAAIDGAFVAFEIDHVDSAHDTGWSVLVRGQAQRVSDPEEIEKLDTAGLAPLAAGRKPHYVRIVVDQISGRAID